MIKIEINEMKPNNNIIIFIESLKQIYIGNEKLSLYVAKNLNF